ncbi:hypothetical protein V1511DRAFT_504148 [Dipodascopsis uninucleata]
MRESEYCKFLYKILSNPEITKLDILPQLHPEVQNLINNNDDSNGTYAKECFPFLVVTSEHVVGISKEILIKAFMQAHTRFYKLNNASDQTKEQVQEILETSLVLLLIGSENNTALNARRKLVDSRNALGELNLITKVLTSKLKKHSKSPLLWGYRSELLTAHRDHIKLNCTNNRDFIELLKQNSHTEFEHIIAAGEVHYMNYYAWNYARWLTTDTCIRLSKVLQNSPNRQMVLESYLRSISRKIEKWCFGHPSDASGWSFFSWLLVFYVSERPESTSPSHIKQDDTLLLNTTIEVFKFATTVSLGHEAVWIFLRRIISDPLIISDRVRNSFLSKIVTYVDHRKNDSNAIFTKDEQNHLQDGSESANTPTMTIREMQMKRNAKMLDNLQDQEISVISSCIRWISTVSKIKKAN